MYTQFAHVYDELMREVPYAQWAGHYRALMRRCGVPEGARCAECACGTGSLTVPLARMGCRMTGIDLSADMLEEAMKKARANGLEIPFVRMDMCQMRLPRRADCVIATCDGVNYLTSPERAAQFFAAAFAALRPGGALIFDVSTPEKLKNTLGNNTLFSDDGKISYIWRNRWQEKTACVQMALSLFVRRPDGAYDRLEEAQTQRAYGRAELRKLLKEAGFCQIAFFGRMRLSPPRTGDDRWHVTAVKPRESTR